MAAKITKKEKHFKYIWLRNGKVMMRKSDADQVIVINSLDDLKIL